MEIMNIISIVILGAVAVLGTAAKIYTRRRLRDMEGCGQVDKDTEQNIIAKF